jgi:CheY-like chemotaxis protein
MTEERKYTVLVVDDDEGVRKVLGQWVERFGYDLKSADSAETAIKELEAGGIDVALCDVRMPGADGIWLADRIRERFPHVGVVLATGLHEMDPSVTLRPGVVAYVVKPFSHTEIAAAIQTGVAWRENYVARPSLRVIEGALTDND